MIEDLCRFAKLNSFCSEPETVWRGLIDNGLKPIRTQHIVKKEKKKMHNCSKKVLPNSEITDDEPQYSTDPCINKLLAVLFFGRKKDQKTKVG